MDPSRAKEIPWSQGQSLGKKKYVEAGTRLFLRIDGLGAGAATKPRRSPRLLRKKGRKKGLPSRPPQAQREGECEEFSGQGGHRR